MSDRRKDAELEDLLKRIRKSRQEIRRTTVQGEKLAEAAAELLQRAMQSGRDPSKRKAS